MTFKDILSLDEDSLFNMNEFAEEMLWDHKALVAISEDLEGKEGEEVGTQVLRKKVFIQKKDLDYLPATGDEINIRELPGKSEYWVVDTLIESSGILEVTFYRYTS